MPYACPEAAKAYSRAWNKTEKGRACVKRASQKHFAVNRYKKYGLTVEQVHEMMARQQGTCAICSDILSAANKSTHVDHCHATGKVRGILCRDCNHTLGRAKENMRTLRRAAEYLEAHA
jgi:hypothetical protein